jgi:hypothetical protein
MGMGIEMLHAQKVEIGSVGAIQEELRRRGFRVTYSGHGGEKELRADNDDLFRAPKPDRGRGNSTIELVRPRNRDEPVGVRIKGLRATAELVWERDSTGAWVHDVVFY